MRQAEADIAQPHHGPSAGETGFDRADQLEVHHPGFIIGADRHDQGIEIETLGVDPFFPGGPVDSFRRLQPPFPRGGNALFIHAEGDDRTARIPRQRQDAFQTGGGGARGIDPGGGTLHQLEPGRDHFGIFRVNRQRLGGGFLDYPQQPLQILDLGRALSFAGAGVDVDHVRPSQILLAHGRGDRFGVPLVDGRADTLQGAVDFFADDQHGLSPFPCYYKI